jgi:hypothetical protein
VVAFAVPTAAKYVLGLIDQLRDGPRDDSWQAFVNVIASGQYALLSTVWEQACRHLGLEITPSAVLPCTHAIRESYDPLTNRVAWRV